MVTFEDIRIVALDENLTTNPDPSKLLYDIHLKLSARPTYEWSELFAQNWRFPSHSLWHRAWVSGNYVVINAPLSELEETHFPSLKEVIQETNS